MLLRAHGFPGPTALLTGPADAAAIDFAIGVLLRYSKNYGVDGAAVIVETAGAVTSRPVQGQQVIDDAELVTHGGTPQMRHLRKQVAAST